jgi:hypothetical protein
MSPILNTIKYMKNYMQNMLSCVIILGTVQMM